MPPLLEVRNLHVRFPAQPESAAAVRDVSFSIAPGESLGLVGESGSGKSVTSLAIMRLLPPGAQVSGEVLFTPAANGSSDGSVLDLLRFSEADEGIRRLRGRHISMIFQEPMTALNPVMRVGDQVAEAVRAHTSSVGKKQAGHIAVEALRDVQIPDPERRARDYPHQLSGGQRQRVMIAMAIVNRPQLLIADEPTTALDVTVQAQVLALLAELRRKFALAMLFISHDLAVVSQVADRVAVMYGGSIVEMAAAREIFRAPAHPYTRGLLNSVPTLQSDRKQPLRTIEDAARRRPTAPLVEIAPGHFARR